MGLAGQTSTQGNNYSQSTATKVDKHSWFVLNVNNQVKSPIFSEQSFTKQYGVLSFFTNIYTSTIITVHIGASCSNTVPHHSEYNPVSLSENEDTRNTEIAS